MEQEILNCLKRFQHLYEKLVKANNDFLVSEYKEERFQNLVYQRDIIFEDIQILEKELAQKSNSSDQSFVLKKIKEDFADNNSIQTQIAALGSSLEELINTDNEVENKLLGEKRNLRTEINKLKRGAKGLRGYMQSTPMGSAFIDKIR